MYDQPDQFTTYVQEMHAVYLKIVSRSLPKLLQIQVTGLYKWMYQMKYYIFEYFTRFN